MRARTSPHQSAPCSWRAPSIRGAAAGRQAPDSRDTEWALFCSRPRRESISGC